MMKRGFVIVLALLGCGPNYESGKTECSQKLECPGGYTCGSEQSGSTPVCYSQSLTPCTSGKPFYCKWAGVCAAIPSGCPGGGGAGGSGGSGPESCTTDFPVYCPALGGATAGCWETGTDCSSVMSCSGTPVACLTGGKVYCDGVEGQKCCRPSPAGGKCNLPACGCPQDYVCYPDTVATGMICLKSTGVTEGEACGSKDVCAEGAGCFGSLCRPYCKTASDCTAVDNARACNPTYWSDSEQEIPGVSYCARVCDPVSPQNPRSPLLDCPFGYGCNSASGSPGASNCFLQSGTLTANAACTKTAECAPGHFCDTTSKKCLKFCFTTADCPTGVTCNYFTPAEYAGQTQVGYCK